MAHTDRSFVLPVAAPAANLRWARLLLGIVLTVLGLALLASPGAAAVTLAWLVGLGLIVHGLEDLMTPLPPRGLGVLAGLVSIAAGTLSLAWPGVTLWVLAVVTGISFLVVGLMRTAVGFLARDGSGWVWAVVAGLLSVLTGLLALAWPGTTALVLALLLGVRTLSMGLVEILMALDRRRPAPVA